MRPSSRLRIPCWVERECDNVTQPVAAAAQGVLRARSRARILRGRGPHLTPDLRLHPEVAEAKTRRPPQSCSQMRRAAGPRRLAGALASAPFRNQDWMAMLSAFACVVFGWSCAADVMGPIVTAARGWCGEAPRTRFSGRVYAAAGSCLGWHDFCSNSRARSGEKSARKRDGLFANSQRS